MNEEAIQDKMDTFFENVDPKQLIKQFEALGYEFEDIDPEIDKIVQENYWDLL